MDCKEKWGPLWRETGGVQGRTLYFITRYNKTCLYADGNDPVERKKLIIQEWGHNFRSQVLTRTRGQGILSNWWEQEQFFPDSRKKGENMNKDAETSGFGGGKIRDGVVLIWLPVFSQRTWAEVSSWVGEGETGTRGVKEKGSSTGCGGLHYRLYWKC